MSLLRRMLGLGNSASREVEELALRVSLNRERLSDAVQDLCRELTTTTNKRSDSDDRDTSQPEER